MTRSSRYSVVLAFVVSLLVLLNMQAPTVVHADNSKDAHNVGVCTAVYHGETFTAELADLDTHLTADERASMETMMLNRWLLPEIAGKYNHEYFDYPNPPKSVHLADLTSWSCKWTAGNKAAP